MKRVLSFLIALSMMVAYIQFVEQTAQAANYTYDANAAIAYAKNNYNANSGQLCAEFVTNCVKEGGLNVAVQSGTGPAYRAIGNAIGIDLGNESNKTTYNKENLKNIPDLELDAQGNAPKSLNGDILQAGDVVIQWCYTCKISPHLLICGGYNSKGNATYYARNGSLGNGTYNLSVNKGKDSKGNRMHPDSCNMGAKVISLSAINNQVASVAGISIDITGICIAAGSTLQLTATVNPSNATDKSVAWSSSDMSVATVNAYGLVTAKAAGNVTITATVGGKSASSMIEVLKPETPIAEPSPVPSQVKFSAMNVRKITTSNAEPYCSISYTGTRPSSVGLYLGTAKSSMSKKASDTINHSKNPFDAWYDISAEANMSLTAGTTYYYQFYAIVNGTEHKSDVGSFTTAKAADPVTFSSIGVRNVTSKNAEPYCTMTYTGSRPSKVGLLIGTTPALQSTVGSDEINHNKNPFEAWYNLNSYGHTLTSGTIYYYQFFAIVDGVRYYSEQKTFTAK